MRIDAMAGQLPHVPGVEIAGERLGKEAQQVADRLLVDEPVAERGIAVVAPGQREGILDEAQRPFLTDERA